MELFQGEEPAHDFLSLRAGGSSAFQHRQRSGQQGPKSLEPASGGGTASSAAEWRLRMRHGPELWFVVLHPHPQCGKIPAPTTRDLEVRRLVQNVLYHYQIANQVIEYIRLLQEKCQKYESGIPEQNDVDANCMPWDKVYYRSRWRNTQVVT
ncbi:hypothetical protein TRIUR3_26424 [Triticum urartu]|uniref:Uncharacterized protein n=1 Tax=Triticum urartu TaxID=4572 RepID=M7Z9U6_TRIUA|nr:hypothetical protein TRIUR3_26424 [Triticum urartu]